MYIYIYSSSALLAHELQAPQKQKGGLNPLIIQGRFYLTIQKKKSLIL